MYCILKNHVHNDEWFDGYAVFAFDQAFIDRIKKLFETVKSIEPTPANVDFYDATPDFLKTPFDDEDTLEFLEQNCEDEPYFTEKLPEHIEKLLASDDTDLETSPFEITECTCIRIYGSETRTKDQEFLWAGYLKYSQIDYSTVWVSIKKLEEALK